MAKIFVFDDQAGQTEVKAALAGAAVEIAGSDDFDEALELLHAGHHDLLIVSVAARVLGLQLLDRLRTMKDHPPVMVLAEPLTQAQLATAGKLGVSAIVARPVAPEQLRAQVAKRLGVPLAKAPEAKAPGAAARPQSDLLLGDCDGDSDGDGGSALRSLLPRGFTMDSGANPEAILERCRAIEYRMVVLDSTHASLLPQVKSLQRSAKLVVVYLRTRADRTDEAHRTGYADYLTRPFDRAEVAELLYRHLDWRELLPLDGNVLRPAPFPPKSRHIDDYYAHLMATAPALVDAAANACYDDLILDLSHLPAHLAHSAALIVEVGNHARRLGLAMRVVAPSELTAMVKSLPGEHDFEAFETLEAAAA